MPYFDPGVWNLDIPAGATYSKRATQSGTAVIDFTGLDARAKVRETYTDTDVILSMGTAAGSAVITLGSGYVQVDIDATTTAALGSAAGWVPVQYVWDLEIVNGVDVTRFSQGIFSISPEATR
jgi:hypothetical protein